MHSGRISWNTEITHSNSLAIGKVGNLQYFCGIQPLYLTSSTAMKQKYIGKKTL